MHRLPHCGLVESFDHTGVYKKCQRHAAARPADGALASASSASATRCCRCAVARRTAASTVSLIVEVRSSNVDQMLGHKASIYRQVTDKCLRFGPHCGWRGPRLPPHQGFS
ncbi:hypothetical protein I553_10771 [Mycobacterium xenopi 4042]|uniref:Uncharacterized protein n=1 Tax=Mycobacterium xenopi 4042 TaxID=1299334 RepID=X8DAT1_MYCXE|nr:hypothetical protein I553_10771 [Mycobacterium xenopi 4042]